MLVNRLSNRIVSTRVTCDQGIFTLNGKLHLSFREGAKIMYRSAEPADMRLSISGSGLPFPNTQTAFGPINSGQIIPDRNGNFSFKVAQPNSYYLDGDIKNHIGQGKLLAQPNIKLIVVLQNGEQHEFNLDLVDSAPLRSLTGFPGKWIRSTGRNTASTIY